MADDFTGASDAASFLVGAGMPTVLYNGIPKKLEPAAAAVIALKTRSVASNLAVKESLAAFDYLLAHDATQLYFKYCSTFDSTPRGNIGPVIQAVLETYGYEQTIIAPSLPINGRVVKDQILYVNGVPLGESSMKDHPLNPMWTSSIVELMKPQSKLRHGIDYVVPDYETHTDGVNIVKQYAHLPFLTGGSGLLEHLGKQYNQETIGLTSGVEGKAIALSGSCSMATYAQTNQYKKTGRAFFVDPHKLRAGTQTIEELWRFVENTTNPLLYSNNRECEPANNNELVEKTFATLAKMAIERGYKRLIVAGGETSGAVCLALNYHGFYIGDSIAPGVPIMEPVGTDIRLALKSGNFGDHDFFEKSFAMTEVNQ